MDVASSSLSRRQVDFLLSATKILFSSLDHERTVRAVAELCVPEIADWCAVHVAEGRRVRRIAAASIDPDSRGFADEYDRRFPISLDDPMGVGAVIREGKPLIRYAVDPDEISRAARSSEHRALLQKLPMSSVIVVPLSVHGRTLGALTMMQSSSGRRFDATDGEFASELALRAAIAMENALLFRAEKDARATAELARDRMAHLQRATAALAAARTAADVQRVVLDHASGALGAVSALLALVTEDRERLRFVEIQGVPPPSVYVQRELAIDTPVPFTEAVRAGRAIYVPSKSEMHLRWPHTKQGPFTGESWALLPLHDGDVVVGGLAVGLAEPGEMPAEDRGFLEALARQAGLALTRTRLQEALLFQKTLLESQNEAALDGIFFQRADGRVAFYNQRLLEMFKVAEYVPNMPRLEDRLAASISNIADPEAFAREVMRLEADKSAVLRMDIAMKDGRVFDCYSAPVRDDEGGFHGRVWFYRDVTSTRVLERELVAARQQLAHSEKLAAMGTLVSGVAHEVRTPLAYISNSAFGLRGAVDGLLARGTVPAADAARLRESVAAIEEGVDRINRLVTDLRRFTKLETAGRVEVSLDEVVGGAARLFEATHRGGTHLELRLDSRARVLADRVQLQQVVLNLLENAADAARDGRVALATSSDETHAWLAVVDDGPGIAPHVRDRMFEPFFTTKPQGTGLGLSIVRRIVDAHHGTIDVQSAEGKGATFRVVLPRAP